MNTAELKEKVEQAFSTQPYPGDDNLVKGNLNIDPERAEIAAYLRGKHWRELRFQEMPFLVSALPVLAPAAFAFYLPAYLLDMLKEDNTNEGYISPVADFTLFSLVPPEAGSGHYSGFTRKAESFSDEQKNTLAQIISFWVGFDPDVISDDEATRAIAFWSSSSSRHET